MMKGTLKKYTNRMAMGVLLTAALLTSGCSLEDGAFVFRLNGRAEIEKETAQADVAVQQQTQVEQTDAAAQQQTQVEQTDAAVQQQTRMEQTDAAVQTEAPAGRKPLFKDADGTIHGPQLYLGESGKPVYDYDIEASLADAPQEWIEYTYPGRKQSYLSPSGVWLFKDEDGTIHGAQIGTTEIGSILFDYEFDVDEIPAEWR